MRGTLDAAFELNKRTKYYMVSKSEKKIKYSLKKEGASNRLREDSAPGNAGKSCGMMF